MVDLLPQEIVVKKIYISRIAWLKYYIVAAVVFSVAAYLMIGGPKSFGGIDAFYFQVGLLVSGFGLVIGIDIRRLYHKYFITNKRVIKDSGLLKNEVTAWEINNIVNIRVRESLLGRLFEYGTLDILLVDNNKMLLDYVRFPGKTMEMITELVENYKK